MKMTDAALIGLMNDVKANTLLVSGMKAKLVTEGPTEPSPGDLYGDYTVAAGDSGKTVTSWTSRVDALGNSAITSSNVLSWVGGSDVNTGQNIKGFMLVSNVSNTLLGAEYFPDVIAVADTNSKVELVVNMSIDRDTTFGESQVIE